MKNKLKTKNSKCKINDGALPNTPIDLKLGFTLMELLLAIALFSIIATAIYSSMATGIRVHEKGATLGGEYNDIQLFFHRIAQDLSTAVGINEEYLIEDSQKICFFSSQPMAGGGREIYKTTYNWEREKDYFKVNRLKETYIDSLQETHGEGEEILDKVSKLDFSYGYRKETIMGEEAFLWKSDWGEKALPKMVRIKLEIPKGDFQKIIYCPGGKLGEIKEE